MDIAVITEAISSLGLPIALVIGLCWFVFRIYKDTTAQSKEREEKLYIEIEKNREVNAKAIETIGLYAERLTHIEDTVLDIKTDVNTIKEKI